MFPHEKLEQEFGNYLDLPPENMVACSSGTAALHLALEAFELPSRSEVIVPEFTMIACARAVTLSGLTPVFVDCSNNLLLHPEKTINALTSKTRVIMPVHIYGRQCDTELFHLIKQRTGCLILEDMAETVYQKPHPKTDAACWSFYKNKIIAGEEGGLVYFHQKSKAQIARQLRCQGFTSQHNFLHKPRGHNYRLADCLASLVLDSLHNVSSNTQKRRHVVSWYDEVTPNKWLMPPRQSPWVYDVRIPKLKHDQQHQIIHSLNCRGIPARCSFRSMSEQPEYQKPYKHLEAYQASQEVLYLPVFPQMQKSTIADTLKLLKSLSSS
jgi:perosamine synthetase